ncbi:MAG: hypothetical protein BWX65_00645 [Bacteroidetes bacterium ADurb.Bin057]|jgi:hypothetical protein|nr:MAG: hypothetical protein BWX65_00645 [Bacteroidetes bacterium ADurb.Bin057]
MQYYAKLVEPQNIDKTNNNAVYRIRYKFVI